MTSACPVKTFSQVSPILKIKQANKGNNDIDNDDDDDDDDNDNNKVFANALKILNALTTQQCSQNPLAGLLERAFILALECGLQKQRDAQRGARFLR